MARFPAGRTAEITAERRSWNRAGRPGALAENRRIGKRSLEIDAICRRFCCDAVASGDIYRNDSLGTRRRQARLFPRNCPEQ
ncbi:hypothetical protein FRAAL3353 [Frankia alni ACN14a]|uniref:Uncharacterized protein n=1 Tax=Frankia alni (strain DSM 45986 / CECT 9034 / ACN14a) TaxID=326424 RepID=Q0RKG1_FRAAA|nr:hypothetical protein FRAAL3353 [Frankia alni ACN14a]